MEVFVGKYSFEKWFKEEFEKRQLTEEHKIKILLSRGLPKDFFDQEIKKIKPEKIEFNTRGLDHTVIMAISELLSISEAEVIQTYKNELLRRS